MSEKVKLTIDGKEVEVNEGITVLQAAKQIGIDIPTLCFLIKQENVDFVLLK